jgi:hypothetical protein
MPSAATSRPDAHRVRRYAARFPRFAQRFGLDDPEAFEAYARRTVIVRISLAR